MCVKRTIKRAKLTRVILLLENHLRCELVCFCFAEEELHVLGETHVCCRARYLNELERELESRSRTLTRHQRAINLVDFNENAMCM
jgi:hypothetical protein